MKYTREQIEQALAVMPCAGMVLDERGSVQLQNRHAAALASGGSEDEALSFMGVPPARAGELEHRRFTAVLMRPDGGSFAADVSVQGLTMDGQPVLLATVHPLPDTSSHEEELWRTPALLRQAVRLVQLGVFEHDHISGRIYVSPEYRAIYGWSADEPVTLEKVLECAYPADAERIIAAVARAHDPAGDGVMDAEGRLIRRDGELRWVRTRSQTYFAERDGKRAPVRTIGALVDITETKEALEAQKRLVSMFEATPDLVGIVAPDGALLYANQAARDALGLGDTRVPLGRQIRALMNEEQRAELFDVVLPTCRREGTWRGELLLNTSSGLEQPYAVTVLAHHGEDHGSPAYFSAIAHDLASIRKLEEQVRQSQKMGAIGRLAGGIAHDFNNLLSVILGYVELAELEVAEDSRLGRHLREAGYAAERAADLTRQMLAFSRKQVMRPSIVDLGEVLRDMQPMIRRVIGEDIDVVTVMGQGPACVTADRSQLEQVLLNLVINARDAMPEGGKLTLEVGVTSLSAEYASEHVGVAPGKYVMMAVSDTGVGMDAVTKARIFEPFFSTKGPGRGTGLGLATVFGIVKQSGGNIWVYSEPSGGTTFKVYLPYTEGQPEDDAKVAPSARPQTRKCTVLVVEDEEQLRSLIVTVLRDDGHEVIAAADPLEALALAAAYPGIIDVLLTDVVMPHLNGKQLADQLLAVRPEVRVLYMSGYTENTIVHRGVLDEGVHFIPKPVAPNRLREALEQVLQK